MPARSKSQQKLMAMVYAVQKGKMKSPSKKVEELADSMSQDSAKDFASTKHTGLPEKKESGWNKFSEVQKANLLVNYVLLRRFKLI